MLGRSSGNRASDRRRDGGEGRGEEWRERTFHEE